MARKATRIGRTTPQEHLYGMNILDSIMQDNISIRVFLLTIVAVTIGFTSSEGTINRLINRPVLSVSVTLTCIVLILLFAWGLFYTDRRLLPS